jgi:hypothetical protein
MVKPPLWREELHAYFKNGRRRKIKVSLPEYKFMDIKRDRDEETRKDNYNL